MMTKTLLLLIFLSAPAYAGTAFKTGEVLTGMTKQCYYDYLGMQYIITVKSYQLCPLTIQVSG